ncbi:MAG TPA: phage terminase small subunit P27 family [Nitrobacter sp.]|nr:phage terminase small subunit P27 family [Nitrobacter sp.]
MTRGVKPAPQPAGKAFRKVKAPPKWMDDDARAEWRRVMPSLVERRILTESDLGSLENYCMMIAVGRQMERKLRAEGFTYVDEKGSIKRHPAAAILADAVNKARLFATELGLTPVSRGRPTVTDDDDDDSLIEDV